MSPKRFLIGFVGGLGLALVLFFAAFYRQLGAPTLSSQWCWDINVKKHQLALAAGTPKLLLIGGSSTLFGLSAKTIQTETGFPTVNMGTHAALGPEYIMRLARQSARPGDTVLLAFEYEVYHYFSRVRGRGWTDQLYFDYLFARDPDYFRSWPLTKQLSTAMLISTRRLKEGLRNRGKTIPLYDGGVYNPTNVNAFGDQTNARISTRPSGQPWLAVKSQNLSAGMGNQPTGFENIREFIQWARTNNVRVLATFPSIAYRPEYDQPPARRTIDQIKDFFASENVPVVGTAQEAMLAGEKYFYDTLYHPTEQGSIERTKILVKHLAPLLKTGDATVRLSNANPAPK